MVGWTTGTYPPISSELINYGFTGIGNYAYLVGGQFYDSPSGALEWLNKTYVYNINLNAWSAGVNSPFGSYIYVAISVGQKIVCFGRSYDVTYVNIFNTQTNSWEPQKITVPPIGLSPNYYNYTAIGDKIYYTTARGTTTMGYFIVYDTTTNQWSSSIPIPYLRLRFGLTSHLNNLYVIGGDKETSSGSWQDVDRLDILNTQNSSWSQGAHMPLGKYAFNTVTMNGEIYAIAGQVNESPNTNINISDVQVYNINENFWSNVQNSPVSGNFFIEGIAAVLGRILFMYNNIMHIYDSRDAKIISQSPAEGFINEKTANTFTWTLESTPEGLTQKSATFQWRIKGSSTINSVAVGTTQYVQIPANIFPNAQIEWRVTATNTAGIVAPYSAWITIATIGQIPVEVVNMSPSAGFVNEQSINTFTWDIAYKVENIDVPIAQTSATFQWRVAGSTTINSISTGSVKSATIPARTLPNGSFEWRILQATTDRNAVASTTAWNTLTTIDQKPNKPTGLYPNTGSRDGTKTIQFSWLHNSPLSTPQSAFELQMTYDGGTTWRALSNKVTTANTQFTAAANIIIPTDPTGRIGWRVRTYNSDNVASDWSATAFFVVHPAPQTPKWVSVEAGRSRPLARWTSLGQVGFQLQVLSGATVLFDSEDVFGTQTEYRLSQFLNNGVYTFRIRIKNTRGLYSAWANRSVSINARHSLNITLRGAAVEGGAELDFNVEVRAGG